MKKYYSLKSLILLLLFFGLTSNAQVGIGTANPLSTLHVNGTFRVTNTNNTTTTTKLTGTCALGIVSDIGIGENLSLVGNVLSSNAGKYGIANITFPVTSSNQQFDNIELNVGTTNVNKTVFRLITGSSSNFTLGGIKGGTDGRHIIIYNTSTGNMSIDHNSLTNVGNSFDTLGSTTSTAGIGTVELVFDGVTNKWLVINVRN